MFKMRTQTGWYSLAFALGGFFAALPARAIETGLEATATGAGLTTTGTPVKSLPKLAGELIAPLLALVGVVFLVITVYGGFLWMISAGESDKVTKAKGLIVNGVIGLIIVAAAYVLVNFVLQAVLNAVKP